jgi:hypothetical protein
MKRLLASLIVVHRWLGLVFCLIFLIWFASGIVMVYRQMPAFAAEERLARLPPLDADTIRLTPAQAYEATGMQEGPRSARLTTFQSRPVYRFGVGGGSVTVFADVGSPADAVEQDNAVSVAANWFPASGATARYLDSKTQPDQWTFGVPFGSTGPIHRVALGDAAATEVYVAEATGEIVMKTDRAGRFWGYAGPVMHWFYFTPLRSQGPVWANLIIYGSVVGCVLCLLGLVIGVCRLSMARRYRHGTSATPYVGWLRWHHYAGLVFGVITFTWTFSGLLTMTPWNWSPGSGPSFEQVTAIRGEALRLDRFTVPPAAVVAELRQQFEVKEIELLQFLGEPLYAVYEPPRNLESPRVGGSDPMSRPVYGGLTPASAPALGPALRRELVAATGHSAHVRRGFNEAELLAAARAAMPQYEPAEVTWLTEFDAYYYSRTPGRGLPALRVKFDDPDGTWLYLDSHDGTLVQAHVHRSRQERWLYRGLHSLDFPRLYQTPWAWYPLVIGLSLGGVALSLTSVIIAWRMIRARITRTS